MNVNEDLKFCENAKKSGGGGEGVGFWGWGSGWIREVFVKIQKKNRGGGVKSGGGGGVKEEVKFL